jgi:hypothetical protein
LPANTGLEAIAGIVVFLFTLVGMDLFFDAMAVATGGKTLSLGRHHQDLTRLLEGTSWGFTDVASRSSLAVVELMWGRTSRRA